MSTDDDTPSLDGFFISREYVEKSHSLGGVQQKIDALAAASTDFDLTGQIVWLVSILTAWYTGTILDEIRGKDVLELGAGAGLVGLVASQAAKRVVLTDYEPEVLSLLERNLRHIAPGCEGSVFSLSWGSESDHSSLRALYAPTCSSTGTGGTGTGGGRWPVLLGADIVYWSESIVPLFATVEALLAQGGVFVLGYFNRNSNNKRTVEELAFSAGLSWSVVDPLSFLPREEGTGEVPQQFKDQLHKMTLYRFTWAEGKGPQ